MTQKYIYTDKVGAGPEHPDKQWGLYSKVLTPEKAKARYNLNAMHRAKWFGVVSEHGDDRPTSYLQVCPRANGVVLQKLNQSGSIEASYTWVAYYTPPNLQPYDGAEEKVFFAGVTRYIYPDGENYYRQSQSVEHTTISFRPDGYAKEEKVTKHGFNEPSDVELSEYQNVDVSANWFTIPDFGDWAAFFQPETKVLFNDLGLTKKA